MLWQTCQLLKISNYKGVSLPGFGSNDFGLSLPELKTQSPIMKKNYVYSLNKVSSRVHHVWFTGICW